MERWLVEKGRIYLAPPDRHLIVDGDRLSLGEEPQDRVRRTSAPMYRLDQSRWFTLRGA